MKRDDLIRELEAFGELLELDGANTFKAGAYPKAARILKEYEADDLEERIANGTLTEIPGIGKGIAQKIEEFAADGHIAELEELREKYPPELLEICRIPGVGAKKTRQLHEELSINNVEELKAACESGKVADLKGFGAKTAMKIIDGIERMKRFAGQHRIDKARNAAMPILERLRQHPKVKEAEIAGSLRRWKEVVKDLDFVAATDSPAEVMEFFTTMENVHEVIGHGETKSSVVLSSGIGADLRCVSPAQYPWALLHFTGSKEHNTELRARAKERGLKLNEYGLFPDGKETSLPARSEADAYQHLGLAYIQPEMREAMGEIDAAAEDKLPALIEHRDLVGIMHLHTHYSDGKPDPEDYARYAEKHGLRWMGISDHSKSLGVARGLNEERVLAQMAEIDEINARWEKKNIRLLKGIESDILEDGRLDYADDFLGKFEFIVASVHTYFNLTEKEQTLRVRRALENPHTTILGHMTGRLLLQRDGFAIDQKEILRHAAQQGVAIEINGNPRRLDVDWRLLRYAVEQGCRITLGPDAHVMEGLEDTRYALAMARKGWLTKADILNCLSVEDFLSFARARR